MTRCTAIIVAMLILCAGAALAQIPPLMNYQGVLTDAGGASAVPDGLYNITFRLYPGEFAASPIWEETKPVLVTKGIFNTILGETAPLEMPFESMLWLGISVEGEAELTPRIPLVSTPYSFNARTVQDSAIIAMKIANGAVTGEKIAGGQVVRTLNGLTDEVELAPGANISITPAGNELIIAATGGEGGVTGSGDAGQVAIWNGTGSIDGDDMLFWDSANKRLGIGTTGPNARLRVESDEQFTGVFASTHLSDGTEVLRANYLGGGNVDAIAVRGISRPAPGFGIGGDFNGGYKGLVVNGGIGELERYVYGIETTASGISSTQSYRYGIWASATGATTGNNLGVVGEAVGSDSKNIGVYGRGNGVNRDAFGIYGNAYGYGTGGRYAVYGQDEAISDSSYAGYFDGNLVYTGSLYKISDAMFKTNLRPVDGALEKILALEPRKYSYDRGRHAGVSLPHGEHYGLIAQEVEEVLPELVGDLLHPGRPSLRGDEPEEESFGYKGINYIELIPILVQAIKEQQQTIEDLKAEVEALKRR